MKLLSVLVLTAVIGVIFFIPQKVFNPYRKPSGTTLYWEYCENKEICSKRSQSDLSRVKRYIESPNNVREDLNIPHTEYPPMMFVSPVDSSAVSSLKGVSVLHGLDATISLMLFKENGNLVGGSLKYSVILSPKHRHLPGAIFVWPHNEASWRLMTLNPRRAVKFTYEQEVEPIEYWEQIYHLGRTRSDLSKIRKYIQSPHTELKKLFNANVENAPLIFVSPVDRLAMRPLREVKILPGLNATIAIVLIREDENVSSSIYKNTATMTTEQGHMAGAIFIWSDDDLSKNLIARNPKDTIQFIYEE